jgi:ankyrin repeat protein
MDDEGWTPLHFAAQGNAAEAARLLLDAGAQVDARDSTGHTPLFQAVWSSRGRGDTIRLLRAYGADPHAQNSRGTSPLRLARVIANFNVRQYFSDLPKAADAEPNSAADWPPE